jgi:hypothetical protein
VHVASEFNQLMDAASRAAWTPSAGVTPSGPTTTAHTLLPPMAVASSNAPRVAVITPVDASDSDSTPAIVDDGARNADDDDALDTDDQSEAAEATLRGQEPVPAMATASVLPEPLADSPWQTPTRLADYDDSLSSAAGAPPSTSSSFSAADASTELLSEVVGDRGVDDAASTISENAAVAGPQPMPSAFNAPPLLGADDDLEQSYSLERSAWAADQRADAKLNKYFAQAHGIRQSTAKVVRHAPSIGADGRLFVSGVSADKAPRLVVPSERVPALISATHERLDHRSADAVRIELQKAFWWPRMHKQIDEWCARCPICATRLRAQRPTPELASFPRAARFAAIHEWVDVFGPAESLHPDDALEFNSKELRSMCSAPRYAPDRRRAVQQASEWPGGTVHSDCEACAAGALARSRRSHVGRRAVASRVDLHDNVARCAAACRRSSRVRGGVSPYELTYGQAPVSQEARALQAAAPRAKFAIGEGAQAAAAAKQAVEALASKAHAARDKAAAKPLAAAQAAPTFALGDTVWWRTPNRLPSRRRLNRQKRFGVYVVHLVDATNARVQLRVLATGRVVTDRRAGRGGKPVWIATRRLTKTSGDVTQPHGAWIGSHDRNALPSAERAAQAALDEKESMFRTALVRRPAYVKPDESRPAALDIGDGRIVDVVALRQTPTGPVATVILKNGRAVEVEGKRYKRITRMARHLAPEVQRLRARHAPDVIEMAP